MLPLDSTARPLLQLPPSAACRETCWSTSRNSESDEIGYILISVDELGAMTIHEKRFEFVDDPTVTVAPVD